jgi:hypothetical protein
MDLDTFEARSRQLADLRAILHAAFAGMPEEERTDLAKLTLAAEAAVLPLLAERNTLVRDLAAANEDLAAALDERDRLSQERDHLAAGIRLAEQGLLGTWRRS